MDKPVRLTVKAIISDIIGTTTPFNFLSETIRSLMRQHFSSMLEKCWDVAEVQLSLRLLLQEADGDLISRDCATVSGVLDRGLHARITEIAEDQMTSGREAAALKTLQGHILATFYEEGLLEGLVYDDVLPAFKSWKESGIGVIIYSSGSTKAQNLLFKHSNVGSLVPYIDAYFDTTTGRKTDPASYTAICKEMGFEPRSVVFIADMIGEVEAAHAAGLQTLIADRPGNPCLDPERSRFAPIIQSFDVLQLTLEDDNTTE
ncbi:enolase-phosphatase E1-like [Sycon ciliatum]|uniref:enolase-phosphatase E1-like n=1 Tax=Sycon ciliatum TaxID=27933 RepID=UPI0020AA01E5|eukprot:scpid80364/ scgid35001/ Enolase-phosphatase E1; 2,3-diketo-5-methylthio-1-phosphopentane phosphatase